MTETTATRTPQTEEEFEAAMPISGTVETFFGDFGLDHSFPSRETADRIYDLIDHQRAAQLYLWGIPLVGMTRWSDAYEATYPEFGDNVLVSVTTFNERRGILTANESTDYFFGFSDTRDAATVLVIPDGLMVGMVVDMWQQSPSDVGIFGPDAERGGTHVIVGPRTPASAVPERTDGQLVHHITTDRVFFVLRALGDEDEVAELVSRIRLYHHGDEPSMTIIDGDDRFTAQYQPRGLAFWEVLHHGINDEVVAERDRLFMYWLRMLGIEKGKPFDPDDRQRAILEDGAKVGELMAKTLVYNERLEGVLRQNNRRFILGGDWGDGIKNDQRMTHYDIFDPRARYCYEAVTTSPAMTIPTTGAEELATEEIRLTALGTGYPARRGQGCAGFLVELGNGEVFILDAGAGTNAAFNHMRVPYNKATKFFISHYHIDHIADLVVYYDFGQSNGRLEPMHVHGPAGDKRELGMEALIENIYKFAAWHDRTKYGNLDTRGFEMQAHEFVPDQARVVYDDNGVVVKSFPVPHGIYGAVGYRLEYAGMAVVYAGDCEPSTFTVENSQDADVVIHETFNPPHTYVDLLGWGELQAKIVAWTKHTAPEAAAEVFSRTRPSLGMVFHYINFEGTPQPLLDGIRTGYDGPIVLAQDFTVVNVTPEQVVTRMVEPEPAPLIVADQEYLDRMESSPDPSIAHGLPEWLEDSVIPIPMIEEFKKELAEHGDSGNHAHHHGH